MPKIVAAFGCLNVSIFCLCRIFVFFFLGGGDFQLLKTSKMKDGAASGSTETSVKACRVARLDNEARRLWEQTLFKTYRCDHAEPLKGIIHRIPRVLTLCARCAGGVFLSRPLRYNEDAARSCRLACNKQQTETRAASSQLLVSSSSGFSFLLLLPETSKSVTFILQRAFFSGCRCLCVGCSCQRLYWMSHNHYSTVAHLQNTHLNFRANRFTTHLKQPSRQNECWKTTDMFKH